MLIDCLNADAAISSTKRRPCNCQCVLNMIIDNLLSCLVDTHVMSLQPRSTTGKQNTGHRHKTSSTNSMRLRQKTKTGRDWEPGTNVLNKTQDILLETCHIPLTQEVALYSRTGGFTPEQCKLKTVFRNDTTIHFVFKRNALVFFGIFLL